MERKTKALRASIIGLHVFVGLGAVAGGLCAVLSPASPMGISPAALRNGPFRDFLVPGLFLLCVNGLGNLGAGLIALKKMKYSGLVSGAMGAILMAWIAIQCWILQDIGPLHVIYFCIGAAQGLLAFALLYEEDLFPASLLKKWVGAPRERHP
jgi:hypothetical protein